jgi:hypothetical protein
MSEEIFGLVKLKLGCLSQRYGLYTGQCDVHVVEIRSDASVSDSWKIYPRNFE